MHEQVEDVDYEGRTALHVAAAKGWYEVCQALLTDFMAPINVTDHERHAPPRSSQCTQCAVWPTQATASRAPQVTDHEGHTPLHAAVRGMHADVARLIHKAGGRLRWDMVTASGELCEAAKTGNTDKLNLLLSTGCKVNAHDYDRRTALHLGASVGNYAICELLVKASADVGARATHARAQCPPPPVRSVHSAPLPSPTSLHIARACVML